MRTEDKILVTVYLLSDKGKRPVELIRLKAFLYILNKLEKQRKKQDV